MVEEHRLTAVELLQYFLSHYRVDGAGAGTSPLLSSGLSSGSPIAEPPLAAPGGENGPGANDDRNAK